ncbi:hypothetical protein NQ317_011370 [Molorchus minor]|uniref:valine--tRNA ligase n=1 Tax=Molorchus minor TaxID=1323400 RepID=A0ABQ9JDB8_9CUCU|nr:hypothetical protein NQ317_011370 [Molorchus minor]
MPFQPDNRGADESLYLDPGYVPHKVESLGPTPDYFRSAKKSGNTFSLILPPPNITGTLHLGHALTATVEDVLIRWHKMRGTDTMWVPGIDHAGIATQVVVEKWLWKEHHQTRHEIGREQFQQKIWEWKTEKATIIGRQLQRLGVSLDWDRQVFTMDETCTKAVLEAFINLFESGLIYRADHLVNWSCALRSAISDIEVEHISVDGPTKISVPGYEKPVEFGNLLKFAYKFTESDGELVVATTRPETILGDVAVAVHPKDDRYSKFIGRYLWHPFRMEKIPVISDSFVDPGFGTDHVNATANQKLDKSIVDLMDISNEITSSKSLKCSVCNNYLNIAPILTSEDGNINKCGRCTLKGPYLTNRNSLYESIGEKLSFPCVYGNCDTRLAWHQVENHEKSEKNIQINIANDTSHFETEHPGTVHRGIINLTLVNVMHLQSLMKLLIVDNVSYFVIIHTLGTGDRIYIGVFNFDNDIHDYEIKLSSDKQHKKCITYKERVQLYDENRQCLYCLQNLCTMETHVYSKNYPEKQREKFRFYTKIDVLCMKNVLLSDTVSFEISVVPVEIQRNGLNGV